MPAFKDDQLLVIAPGSQTSLAQLGLAESLTPARWRFRSCMFPTEDKGKYEPNKVRRKIKKAINGVNGSTNTDVVKTDTNDEAEYEEDFASEEGAIWPIQAGHVVDWPAFFGLLSYVYETVNPPFHTPVLLVVEPAWTPREQEKITQFFFERFRVPAFTLMDSAVATSYGYGLENAIVVDVGKDKADVSVIAGHLLHTTGRAVALPNCGGEAMTQRLLSLLGGKGFTRSMCEQLKHSSICEILPSDSDIPKAGAQPEVTANPAAAASTGGNEPVSTNTVQGARAAGEGAGVDNKGTEEDNEGVLDIASIVTGGKMNEFIESKEKEKADKAAAKKKGNAAAESAAARAGRLPNSKRVKNTFTFEDQALQDALKDMKMTGAQVADIQAAVAGGADRKASDATSITSRTSTIKREIEVGTERFQAANGGVLDNLADAVFRTVMAVEEVEKRSAIWNSLVVVGNGSRVRGFKEALLSRLQSKYQIYPSSATIFTSEIPSYANSPAPTGRNTPQPQMYQPGMYQGGSGVNPLLVAATTAQTPGLGGQGQAGVMEDRHSSHGQTPTSIKLAKIPEYFPEWKEVGYEEAAFLGAQVAAKVLFATDSGGKSYMTRADYNDQGPQSIHEFSL